MSNRLAALLALATKFERARSLKTMLVAKLAAGRIEAAILPERTRREIKRRRATKQLNKKQLQ